MASINVGEADFNALAGAALDARNAGDMGQAKALDKLARKVNLALAQADPTLVSLRRHGLSARSPMTWRDMPSVIEQMEG